MKSGMMIKLLQKENGSALITAILILMVVTVIGIIATRTANIELQIATHDKVHKMTWFATDATVDGIVPGLLEQAVEMRLQAGDDLSEVMPVKSPDLTLVNQEFFLNSPSGVCLIDTPYPDNADITLAAGAMAQTDLFTRVYGATELMDGSAIQLPEGYHGFGKSLARGGSMINYNIRVLGVGELNSEARLESGWRYIIN